MVAAFDSIEGPTTARHHRSLCANLKAVLAEAEGVSVLLRNVRPDDVDAYVRMRCDPVMMADLGGPLPVDGIAAKVERDVQSAAADTQWIKMIVPDAAAFRRSRRQG